MHLGLIKQLRFVSWACCSDSVTLCKAIAKGDLSGIVASGHKRRMKGVKGLKLAGGKVDKVGSGASAPSTGMHDACA